MASTWCGKLETVLHTEQQLSLRRKQSILSYLLQNRSATICNTKSIPCAWRKDEWEPACIGRCWSPVTVLNIPRTTVDGVSASNPPKTLLPDEVSCVSQMNVARLNVRWITSLAVYPWINTTYLANRRAFWRLSLNDKNISCRPHEVTCCGAKPTVAGKGPQNLL
jgi:hypothetical protein